MGDEARVGARRAASVMLAALWALLACGGADDGAGATEAPSARQAAAEGVVPAAAAASSALTAIAPSADQHDPPRATVIVPRGAATSVARELDAELQAMSDLEPGRDAGTMTAADPFAAE